MKKALFLLQIFTASACFAQANSFPSLASCREGIIGFSESEERFFAIRNHLCHNEEMPVSSIEAILTQWLQEEPELINYACTDGTDGTDDTGNGQPGSYTDVFTIMVKIDSILLETQPPHADTEYYARISGMLARSREVTRVLKKFGVKQTLSDEQVDIFAQQAVKELLDWEMASQSDL